MKNWTSAVNKICIEPPTLKKWSLFAFEESM